MEENLDLLALAETWDNGKPIRETTAADMPLAIDHFRYFAGVLRAQEGGISKIDHDTVAYHFHEPGRRRPDHSVEFPAADGLLEARGARGRQLRGHQARRADTGRHHGVDRPRRGFVAGRVVNIVNGFGARSGEAAGLERASPRSPSPAKRPPVG
jgi:hypothetical protein